MRAVVFAWCAAMVIAGAGLFACNSLLGIDQASPEPVDAALRDAADAGDEGDAASPVTGTDYHLNCDTYCTVIATACTGDNAEYVPNPDVCRAICARLTQNESVSNGVIDQNTDPSSNPATADTLNCRLWHANFAIIEKDPKTHCPHAGPLGGLKCGDACEGFCALDTFFCSGEFAAYEGGIDDCLSACRSDAGGFGATYAPGDPEAKGIGVTMAGNTLSCRMYHLEAALDPNGLGKVDHCKHTSQASTPETCGAAVQDH